MPDDQIKTIKQEKINAFQMDNPPNLPEIDPMIDGLDRSNLDQPLRIPKAEQDLIDETQYSIQ